MATTNSTSPLGSLTQADVDRFWGHVDMTGGPAACWPWTRAKDWDGYGLFKVHGRMLRASRVVMHLEGQNIADMMVCHHCDNPTCRNPVHMFIGTARDNNADRNAKGRVARGERNGTKTHPERVARGTQVNLAKLTDESVVQIRSMYRDGATQVEIARIFSVQQSTIERVVNRKTWRHVDAG